MKFRPVSLALAASLAAGALAVPTFASAQSYGSNGYGYSDPCRNTKGNQTAGAVLGAIAGAALGSNVAGRGAKSEGGAIGAVAGAVIGAQAAKGGSRCGAGYGYNNGYGQYGYGQTSNPYGYGQTYPQQPYGYGQSYPYGYDNRRYDDRRYDDRRYDDRRDYGYGYGEDYGYSTPVADSNSVDGCRLAESPIYLPDGRTEKRYVRVCPDAQGRYRVVD
ncbi:MAG TPA: glycine zipper 2TM domain-containing protein [Caulobacteraceae bacterium]|nr:glycine zipper 2TM domain-containing protein [Caulobacteraceae bacterium]